MKKIIVSFLLVLGLGCNKTDSSNNILQGTYKGTFKRNTSNIISNLTINFSSNNYSGTSSVSRYPATSAGN